MYETERELYQKQNSGYRSPRYAQTAYAKPEQILAHMPFNDLEFNNTNLRNSFFNLSGITLLTVDSSSQFQNCTLSIDKNAIMYLAFENQDTAATPDGLAISGTYHVVPDQSVKAPDRLRNNFSEYAALRASLYATGLQRRNDSLDSVEMLRTALTLCEVFILSGAPELIDRANTILADIRESSEALSSPAQEAQVALLAILAAVAGNAAEEELRERLRKWRSYADTLTNRIWDWKLWEESYPLWAYANNQFSRFQLLQGSKKGTVTSDELGYRFFSDKSAIRAIGKGGPKGDQQKIYFEKKN